MEKSHEVLKTRYLAEEENRLYNVHYNISGSSLLHCINYRSSVNDPYSFLVDGGYWYSGATVI